VFRRQGRAVLRVAANATGCTFLFRGDRLGWSRAYWVWFGPPFSPSLPWMPAARR
jgi:hypothetical protein